MSGGPIHMRTPENADTDSTLIGSFEFDLHEAPTPDQVQKGLDTAVRLLNTLAGELLRSGSLSAANQAMGLMLQAAQFAEQANIVLAQSLKQAADQGRIIQPIMAPGAAPRRN